MKKTKLTRSLLAACSIVALSSMTEYMNADAIVMAKAAAEKAVTDAQAALDDAKGAKTAAEALDDTNEHKSALIAALDAAIMVAEEQLEAATESRDSDDLSDAVDEVTGGENADPPGTPDSKAKDVAMAVGEALGGETAAAGIARGTIANLAADIPGMDDANVDEDNHSGTTWMDIVGATKKMRIATSATDTNEVYVSSISGMTAADVNNALTVTGGVEGGDTYADGTQTDSSTYKGIPGTAICAGGDCKVDADGNLGACAVGKIDYYM